MEPNPNYIECEVLGLEAEVTTARAALDVTGAERPI